MKYLKNFKIFENNSFYNKIDDSDYYNYLVDRPISDPNSFGTTNKEKLSFTELEIDVLKKNFPNFNLENTKKSRNNDPLIQLTLIELRSYKTPSSYYILIDKFENEY